MNTNTLSGTRQPRLTPPGRQPAVNHPADHAVVLGAGIGGLTAARVLADHYAHVTVIERDALPATTAARRGVPQGSHMHGLVAHGADLLEGLLPGLRTDLISAGAAHAELLSDFRVSYFGSVLAQVPMGLSLVLSSRPFLEGQLRQRVAALPNVSITDATEAVQLRHAHRDQRITGVLLAPVHGTGSPQLMEADLVVDATGRAGRSATWLGELGYPRPAETKVRVDVAYASRHYRMRPGAMPADKVTLVGPRPHRPRGMSLVAQENGLWVMSLYGYGKENHPPTEQAGFGVFARQIAPPDAWSAVAQAEPVDGISGYKFPATIQRHYHKDRRLPDGLVVLGEGIGSSNPIYGTGMTAAITQAVILGEVASERPGSLPRSYYHRVNQRLRMAWLFSNAADKAMPDVPGIPKSLKSVMAKYYARVMAAGATDPEIAETVIRIIDMTNSPLELLKPRYIRPILKPTHGHAVTA